MSRTTRTPARRDPMPLREGVVFQPEALEFRQELSNKTAGGSVSQQVDFKLAYTDPATGRRHTDFDFVGTLNTVGRYTEHGKAPNLSQPPRVGVKAIHGPDADLPEWRDAVAGFRFLQDLCAEVERRWRAHPEWYAGVGPQKVGQLPPKTGERYQDADGNWQTELVMPADYFKVPVEGPTPFAEDEEGEGDKYPAELALKIWARIDEGADRDASKLRHAADNAPMTLRELEELCYAYRFIREPSGETYVRSMRSRMYHAQTAAMEERSQGQDRKEESTWVPPALARMTVWPNFYYKDGGRNGKGFVGAGMNLMIMGASVFVDADRAALAPPPTCERWALPRYAADAEPGPEAAAWWQAWWARRHAALPASPGPVPDGPDGAAEPERKRARTSEEEP